MNRRAARWLAPIRLLIAAVAILGASSTATLGDPASVHATVNIVATSSVTTVPEPPPITANDFLPEDRDLSDCVGVLEKPGCGSEERGGPMMTIVFALVIAGMAFIFWRVIAGVRKNRSDLDEKTGIGP